MGKIFISLFDLNVLLSVYREYLSSNGKRKQGEMVTAHLKLKPEVNLAYTTRVAQLEHRYVTHA